jgi:hypothetical protein
VARAAGTKGFYTFAMMDYRGRKTGTEIHLPSVTTVIGKTLAKPMLVDWAYRQTRDVFVGLAGQLEEGVLDIHDYLETFSDEADAEAWMAENKLRPRDVASDSAEEGTEAHSFLEYLADLSLKDYEKANEQASSMLRAPRAEPKKKAVAEWWLERQPAVLQSEATLYSLRNGFAGTVDLVYIDGAGKVVLMDLKTRRVGLPVYESDDVQTGAYEIAYLEMNPGARVDYRTVLLAYDDGTWYEGVANIDARTFLMLLSVYRNLQNATI